jgi:hypothetical protein
MFDLMIATDAVQRRSRQAFSSAPKRRLVRVRVNAAARLRALADRLEPVGAGRSSEPAGAYQR